MSIKTNPTWTGQSQGWQTEMVGERPVEKDLIDFKRL
jgi:hypothetical protein